MTVEELKSMGVKRRVETSLLVQESTTRETKTGNPYINLRLADATGEINAVSWGADEAPPAGSVIIVGGKTSAYKGESQLVVDHIKVDNEASLEGFLKSAHRPGAELLKDIRLLVDTFCEPERTGRLVHHIIDGMEARLITWPAAKGHHHARVAGLIEHIHSMAHMAVDLCTHYDCRYSVAPDPGIVIAGVVLHDLGKTVELSGAAGTEYTDTGKLLGHIVWSVGLLERAFTTCNIDHESDLATHLHHLVASHHGRMDWGSPVEPKTAEAMLLHQLDMMDSTMDKVLTALAHAGDAGGWVEAGYRQEFYKFGGRT